MSLFYECLCSYSLLTVERHQWNTSLLIHQVSAVCSWDSSIHDSVHLNRVTSPNERIYLIIKATVQLSHPASMELVLRKRIAVNVYNKQVITRGIRFYQKRAVHNPQRWDLNDEPDFNIFPAEFHTESQEKNVPKEHALLLLCNLWDCFQHTKGTNGCLLKYFFQIDI